MVIPSPDPDSPPDPGRPVRSGRRRLGACGEAGLPVHLVRADEGGAVLGAEQGWWVQSRQCYAKVASTAAGGFGPGVGGAYGGCGLRLLPTGAGGWRVHRGPVLVGLASWGGAPPDPRTLAQQAVAVMNLRAVRIGMVPVISPRSKLNLASFYPIFQFYHPILQQFV